MVTQLTYYDTSSEWGKYQYITLEQIVIDFISSRDDDDYTSTTPRHQILYHARRGLREFYYDVLREVKAIELELSEALYIPLPQDYVDYVRISWVDEYGRLHPLAIDNQRSIAVGYLQDHAYNLLFDNNGEVLQDDGLSQVKVPSLGDVSSYQICESYFQPNRNNSNVFSNGGFTINKTLGVIQFSSSVQSKSIVIEYISDGLFDGISSTDETNVKIHKFAESAIMDYIYYELIKNRRNVPSNEKLRARKEFYNSRRNAKMRINKISKADVIQAFKGSTKWIK